MGNLHTLCNELRDYGTNVPIIGAELQSVVGWSECVLPALDAMSSIYGLSLGGGSVPSEDRGLAASTTTSFNSSTPQPSTLTFDDEDEEAEVPGAEYPGAAGVFSV